MGRLVCVHKSDGATEILLKVPALASQCSLVRAGAAAVAEREELPQNQIDEICFAVDQAFTMLLEAPAARNVRIHTKFLLNPQSFQVEITRTDKAAMSSDVVTRFKQTVASTSISAAVESQQSKVKLILLV